MLHYEDCIMNAELHHEYSCSSDGVGIMRGDDENSIQDKWWSCIMNSYDSWWIMMMHHEQWWFTITSEHPWFKGGLVPFGNQDLVILYQSMGMTSSTWAGYCDIGLIARTICFCRNARCWEGHGGKLKNISKTGTYIRTLARINNWIDHVHKYACSRGRANT